MKSKWSVMIQESYFSLWKNKKMTIKTKSFSNLSAFSEQFVSVHRFYLHLFLSINIHNVWFMKFCIFFYINDRVVGTSTFRLLWMHLFVLFASWLNPFQSYPFSMTWFWLSLRSDLEIFPNIDVIPKSPFEVWNHHDIIP